MSKTFSIGLVGARGHTGRELLKLINTHPGLHLAFASSRELAGRPVSDLVAEFEGKIFENLAPEMVANRGADICILALPNGAAAPFVEALSAQAPEKIIIDLSADYRFDDEWSYGLPELYTGKQELTGARRIANPGCYATAAQLAIHPALDLLAAPPSVFGVSGYSGAGTTPSPKNDVARLESNLIPYALTGHLHEKEVSHHLGREVHFSPHVHPAFSGLLVTVHLAFNAPQTTEGLVQRYQATYKGKKLICVQSEIPELKEGTGIPGALIGGFSISENGFHGVIVVAEDNLLKGAAVQAIQNINLAIGLDQYAGIAVSPS